MPECLYYILVSGRWTSVFTQYGNSCIFPFFLTVIKLAENFLILSS